MRLPEHACDFALDAGPDDPIDPAGAPAPVSRLEPVRFVAVCYVFGLNLGRRAHPLAVDRGLFRVRWAWVASVVRHPESR